MGYSVIRKPQARAPASYRDPARKELVYLWVSALGIVGGLLLLIDAQALGTELSISYLVNNLGRSEKACSTPAAVLTRLCSCLGSC